MVGRGADAAESRFAPTNHSRWRMAARPGIVREIGAGVSVRDTGARWHRLRVTKTLGARLRRSAAFAREWPKLALQVSDDRKSIHVTENDALPVDR